MLFTIIILRQVAHDHSAVFGVTVLIESSQQLLEAAYFFVETNKTGHILTLDLSDSQLPHRSIILFFTRTLPQFV